MNADLLKAMEPIIIIFASAVMEDGAEILEKSMARTTAMLNKYSRLGHGGYAGPMGDPVAQARMRKLVKCEEAPGAKEIEQMHVNAKWAVAVDNIMEELTGI